MIDMRIIKIIVFSLLMLVVMPASAETAAPGLTPSDQVMVNGRVATFGSVVASCDGDSVAASKISRPLPAEGTYLPSWRVRLEEAFNLMGLRWGAPVISFLLLALLIAGIRRWRPWCVVAAVLLLIDFVVRCLLAERVGLTGRSDCLLAVALGISLIIPWTDHRKTAVAGTILMVILSVAGAVLMVHPAVRPFNPALDSGWLPLHVGLMAASYSLFVFAACAAVAGMNVWRLRNVLIIGEVFLAGGIASGSAWAAEAWGSWWSWDPKETFALATAVVYLLLILFWDFIVRNKAVKALTVCALACVAVTWFGLSRLGGNHAYDQEEIPQIAAGDAPVENVSDTTINQNIMKKNLEIPYVPELNNLEPDQIAAVLDEKGVRQTIDCVNWPESFPYKPLASFTAANSGKDLFIEFTVRGYGLRAVNKDNNSDVYMDSCVEFFVSPDGDDHYRNFEFSCIGTVHAACRLDRHNGELLSDDKIARIRRYPSSGTETFDEKEGMHTWTLTVAIPLDLMGVTYEPGKSVKLHGNFYKCGDGMKKIHYLSWSPIGTPEPDFHCPAYFGDITLL